MCGIYFSLYYDSELEEDNLKLIKHRGPDNSNSFFHKKHFFGFHRLALQDISEKGNQPFILKNIILVCNGEIYNFKELKNEYKIETNSDSDCEIILHLYKKIGIEETIKRLSGYFAFILYDIDKDLYYSGRDPFGVRSLYYGKKKTNNEYIFSSEIKALYKSCIPETIKIFPPGHYWNGKKQFLIPYYHFPTSFLNKNEDILFSNLYSLLYNAVKKRLGMEREFGVLLSGGLDSSLIASLVSKIWGKPIRTFSIGLKDSPDLFYAKKVAEFIGSEHTEVEITEKIMLDSIEKVIYQIETFDITTIRASVPMFLLSEYISKNTNIKVIFSGEGSDEVAGGYLYFHKSPSEKEFHSECCRLVKDLYYFDCLRSDKTVSGNGLEVRCPFLDKEFIQYYLSVPIHYRRPVKGRPEKWLLRTICSDKNLLPSEILWRKKEAFSDGVSNEKKSWYKIIYEYLGDKSEKEYYKEIFLKYFNGCETILPYYWMPKWVEGITDPSARFL